MSLRAELEKPSPPLQLLSPKQGEAILDLAREASTTRYRELYGFTHGDARRVFKTNIGRGVDIFVTGLPAEWRLPLRAYHAAMIFKNGVPVGYFEGLSLFERMESGFNLYYTFRDGETAWLYARTAEHLSPPARRDRLYARSVSDWSRKRGRHRVGSVLVLSQAWFSSDEPRRSDKLVAREEEKDGQPIRAIEPQRPTLRKLAAGPMIFELDQRQSLVIGIGFRFGILVLPRNDRWRRSSAGMLKEFVMASVQSLTKAVRNSHQELA